MSSSDREYLNFERRHLAFTTRALKTALDDAEFNGRPLLDFYRAVVSYLAYTMNRLCLQDKRLADLVRDRFKTPDAKLGETLDAVYDRLEHHRQHVAFLQGALAELEAAGPKGQKEFERKARHYLEEREKKRGSHTLTSWRDQVIVESDWAHIAARTGAEAEAEKALFERLEATLPPGLAEAMERAKAGAA